MADWKTVRYDPAWEEKLDEEIIPLCDALNAAGIVTLQSCCGHGTDRPRVWFEHSTDARIESLARFVKRGEEGDYRAYFTMWQKEILWMNPLYGPYMWCVEVHLNNVYGSTPPADSLREAVSALACVTRAVDKWSVLQKDLDLSEWGLLV